MNESKYTGIVVGKGMPAQFKMTVLMFLGMFPVNLGVHHAFRNFPQLQELPALLHAAIMAAVVTVITMHVAMPLLMKLFGGWFHSGDTGTDR